jgi:hypothetical protein
VEVDRGGHIDVDGARKFNKIADVYFEIEDAENNRGGYSDRNRRHLEHFFRFGRKVLEEIFEFTHHIISFLCKIICSDSHTHNFDWARPRSSHP